MLWGWGWGWVRLYKCENKELFLSFIPEFIRNFETSLSVSIFHIHISLTSSGNVKFNKKLDDDHVTLCQNVPIFYFLLSCFRVGQKTFDLLVINSNFSSFYFIFGLVQL